MADPIRTLSLCSGIAGLDLGVELACHGARVVGYVERETFSASVLLARMEDETLECAPVWCGDLRDLDARPMRGSVDLVTAGYPCQPFSVAGNRLGDKDERHLWPEVARIVGEVGPRYVFLENVPGHLRLGFDQVLGDLADLGFDAEWTIVGADDVGAPHRRKRLFVLAYADLSGLERRGVRGRGRADERATREDCREVADAAGVWPPGPDPELWRDIPPEAQPALRGVADGSTRGLERSRLAALGNSVCPIQAAYALRRLMRRT